MKQLFVFLIALFAFFSCSKTNYVYSHPSLSRIDGYITLPDSAKIPYEVDSIVTRGTITYTYFSVDATGIDFSGLNFNIKCNEPDVIRVATDELVNVAPDQFTSFNAEWKVVYPATSLDPSSLAFYTY